ncbi:MAG: prevent-host-death protein [Synechococcaceae cyanobacterium SM2_3_2]|nr:prevent-host-death protein [Synechococcaceae cyanobacterium SM2_3_2]
MSNMVRVEKLPDAKRNLEALCQRVVKEGDEVIIELGDDGQDVVLLSAHELSSLRESLYQLSSKTNADRLRAALDHAKRPKSESGKKRSVRELFNSLNLPLDEV